MGVEVDQEFPGGVRPFPCEVLAHVRMAHDGGGLQDIVLGHMPTMGASLADLVFLFIEGSGVDHKGQEAGLDGERAPDRVWIDGFGVVLEAGEAPGSQEALPLLVQVEPVGIPGGQLFRGLGRVGRRALKGQGEGKTGKR